MQYRRYGCRPHTQAGKLLQGDRAVGGRLRYPSNSRTCVDDLKTVGRRARYTQHTDNYKVNTREEWALHKENQTLSNPSNTRCGADTNPISCPEKTCKWSLRGEAPPATCSRKRSSVAASFLETPQMAYTHAEESTATYTLISGSKHIEL